MRRRIDRFIEDALLNFSDWYVSSSWLGKERDCVNKFVFGFLVENVRPGAAISNFGQIRIESAVPQPSNYIKKTAAKDLVIWNGCDETVWDESWNPVNHPRVVLEWKFKRIGLQPSKFHSHDMNWLSNYTKEFHDTFGYLVRVYDGHKGRSVDWAKVRAGHIQETNRRS